MANSPMTSGLIPNLVNGISQQPPKLRLPSQAQASDNYYPSVVDGLIPRAPSEHFSRLRDNLPAGTFSHFIFRDDNEEYLMALFPDATIKVWDIDGDEKVVNVIGDAADYITGLTSPKDTVRALTVADYTFLVNTTKVVAAGTEESATRPYEALVHVLAGNYGKHYRINIDGELAAGYRTPDGSNNSHSPYIDTSYIADVLMALLDGGEAAVRTPDIGGRASGGAWGVGVGTSQISDGDYNGGFNTAPWALGRYHSTIYIRNTAADFTISVEDG
ncbi:MAG: phage nozzle protein, partial [Aeromicrobium sp.]